MRLELSTILAVALLTAALAGCAQLPYDRTTEASVGGAAAGAAAGAVLAGDDSELMGGLLGGVLGAAAGYVIGAKTDWFSNGHQQGLSDAVSDAQSDPATVADVRGSDDADLNNDGLVTKDELIAMSNAGLSDDEIIDRLDETDQAFSVSREQRQDLLAAGVDPQVVYQLNDINQDEVL